MFELARPIFFYVETPLHPGAGSGLSHIDLPIQREEQNWLPMMQGSGIKGSLRAAARDRANLEFTKDDLETIFGPDTERASDHAGAVSFTDARVLCFPVRSLNGLFAWVTCPFALARFQSDLTLDSDLASKNTLPSLISDVTEGKCYVPAETPLKVGNGENIVLETSVFKKEGDSSEWATKLSDIIFKGKDKNDYWRAKFRNSLVILNDTDFVYFTKRATVITTRIRLEEDTHTVGDGGGLWVEEHLPSETILYSMALSNRPTKNGGNGKDGKWVWELLKSKVLDTNHRMQLGGNETVGKGLVRVSYLD